MPIITSIVKGYVINNFRNMNQYEQCPIWNANGVAQQMHEVQSFIIHQHISIYVNIRNFILLKK